MIEINLIQQKKAFKMPTVLGMDLAKLNYKMIFIALLLNHFPEQYLREYYVEKKTVKDEEYSKLQASLNKLKKEVKKNSFVREQLQAFNAQISKLESRSAQVDKIIKEKTNPVFLLESIAKNAPEDLWITEMKVTETKEINIKGASNTYQSIGSFITRSNETPFFGGTMQLASSKTISETIQGTEIRIESFEIKGNIKVFNPF